MVVVRPIGQFKIREVDNWHDLLIITMKMNYMNIKLYIYALKFKLIKSK